MKPSTAPWPEVIATVTACKYDAGAGRALAFGIPLDKHFLISFNYWANGELHTGEYHSATAVPQGTLFPITYDPTNPHQHNRFSSEPTTRSPIIAIGIAGSVILSLIWLAIMHGCR